MAHLIRAGLKSVVEDDDTVRVARTPPRPPVRRGMKWPILAGTALALSIGAFGWALWPRPAPHASVSAFPRDASTGSIGKPAVAQKLEFSIQTASEEQILANTTMGVSIFRFAANPRILVLDFVSLHDQGMMLNRIGALAEKAGLPRDRVLTDAELSQAIQSGGDNVENFYYGHDYSAATLTRFFNLADQNHIQLNAEERKLRRLLLQEGWFTPGMMMGLISIPGVGADEHVSLEARQTILHHELSHGEYFSNPVYAAYVHQFWRTALTQREVDNIRKHLGVEGYDTGLDELTENEMQAYLMFTDNPAFFTPAMVNMTPARLAELRLQFMRGMPTTWLRDNIVGLSQPIATPVRVIAR